MVKRYKQIARSARCTVAKDWFTGPYTCSSTFALVFHTLWGWVWTLLWFFESIAVG